MIKPASEYIEIAERLADAARPIVRRYFRTPIAIDSKADSSPVTRADREVEAALREILRETCPDHAVIGEEMGGAADVAGPLWVLDPIDGTSAFAAGVTMFGVLIALAIDGKFVLGVIDQPINDERWRGATGSATLFNGTPARVSGCARLGDARLFTTAPEYFGDTLDAFHRVRDRARFTRYGADCYAVGLLASGHVDLVVEAGLKLWDFAALVPVVENAGGVITDWQGAPLTTASDGNLVAASSAALHEATLELLARPG
ncbi:histidinol phosphate phosphatase [bacterium AH-315-B06]|nr:histidinol phosphate phosphatase [bacterium AH-315-B06]